MAFDYAGKIRALLATAEDEALSDETRQSYRNKAFKLMRDYQIAEEEALAVDPTVAVPISVVVDLKLHSWDIAGYYPAIFRRIANHTGVRFHSQYANGGYRFTVVGYEGDVRYTEFLWTAAYLMFSTKIDPQWDTEQPEELNIYRMRAAGLKRKDIADKAWGYGAGDLAANRSKVQRIYKRQAEIHGEAATASGLDFSSKYYREAYAQSFMDTLARRLREARDAADSVGGALVLHGRQERVDEAFYDLFPNEVRRSTEVVAPCEACKKAKSGYCRNHRPLRWTQKDELAWQRRTHSSSAHAGHASGRTAAEGVVIQRGTARAGRIDRSGKAIEG